MEGLKIAAVVFNNQINYSHVNICLFLNYLEISSTA